MARGREDVAWSHTCAVVATVLNLVAGENEKVDPVSIHPLRSRRQKRISIEAPITALKHLL
jgi:hypothetical protein